MAVIIIAVIAIKTVHVDGVPAVFLLVMSISYTWHSERLNRQLCGRKHACELDLANNCRNHIYTSCAKEATTKTTAQDTRFVRYLHDLTDGGQFPCKPQTKKHSTGHVADKCNRSSNRPSTSPDGDVTDAKMQTPETCLMLSLHFVQSL